MTVFSRIAASLVRLPPPRTSDVSVERDLAAKMPDGVVLLADRWFPTEDPGSQPTVLIRTPYGRRVMGPLGRLYAERGYQTLIQSCRATFGSEGEWEPMRHEQVDGHATLAWIASQPWFDGRLVMWGGSYLGGTQWAVAEDAPGLRAGARAPGHGVELRPGHHLPGRLLRPRDGGGLALPDQASGAGLADGAPHVAGRRQGARRRLQRPADRHQRRMRPSASRGRPTRTGSSTVRPVTRGGIRSTSGAASMPSRRRA